MSLRICLFHVVARLGLCQTALPQVNGDLDACQKDLLTKARKLETIQETLEKTEQTPHVKKKLDLDFAVCVNDLQSEPCHAVHWRAA